VHLMNLNGVGGAERRHHDPPLHPPPAPVIRPVQPVSEPKVPPGFGRSLDIPPDIGQKLVHVLD
jgi:hypothetical protein